MYTHLSHTHTRDVELDVFKYIVASRLDQIESRLLSPSLQESGGTNIRLPPSTLEMPEIIVSDILFQSGKRLIRHLGTFLPRELSIRVLHFPVLTLYVLLYCLLLSVSQA